MSTWSSPTDAFAAIASDAHSAHNLPEGDPERPTFDMSMSTKEISAVLAGSVVVTKDGLVAHLQEIAPPSGNHSLPRAVLAFTAKEQKARKFLDPETMDKTFAEIYPRALN
jgi:hypothetical protein